MSKIKYLLLISLGLHSSYCHANYFIRIAELLSKSKAVRVAFARAPELRKLYQSTNDGADILLSTEKTFLFNPYEMTYNLEKILTPNEAKRLYKALKTIDETGLEKQLMNTFDFSKLTSDVAKLHLSPSKVKKPTRITHIASAAELHHSSKWLRELKREYGNSVSFNKYNSIEERLEHLLKIARFNFKIHDRLFIKLENPPAQISSMKDWINSTDDATNISMRGTFSILSESNCWLIHVVEDMAKVHPHPEDLYKIIKGERWFKYLKKLKTIEEDQVNGLGLASSGYTPPTEWLP